MNSTGQKTDPCSTPTSYHYDRKEKVQDIKLDLVVLQHDIIMIENE